MTKKEKRKQLRQYIYDYLKNNPCDSCGESDVACLDFHHINGVTKKAGISEMVSKVVSITVLKQEIDKCTVLCCNCHRKVTSTEQGWYKDLK